MTGPPFAHPDAFPLTRHSVVRALTAADPAARAAGYDAIVRGYWRPVYGYIRLRWRRGAEDARDLTQDFFTRALEKDYLARYDPSKARFRTFLRTCLDAFMANAQQHASRLKRGGGQRIESMDFGRAERELPQAADQDADPDACFRREWIRGLFVAAVDALRARCAERGRALAFAVFTRYDLDAADEADRPTYSALAAEFGVTAVTITNHLAWARREFRDIVLGSLRELCATDEEFAAETRALLGVTPR